MFTNVYQISQNTAIAPIFIMNIVCNSWLTHWGLDLMSAILKLNLYLMKMSFINIQWKCFWADSVNPSKPGQNGQLITDIFKCIFLNENLCILIRISLQFVPEAPIDNNSALVPVMACHWTGDKPLPEPWCSVHRRIYAAIGEMS